mgnify:CR=1 FL=1
MRLISQDGMIDVPYEQASIEVNGNDIYCGYSSIITRHCTGRRFAEYSSKAKALKVMEMLRDCYLGKDCGYHTEHGVCYHSRNDFETKVFKFPADEDVEVQDE